MFAVDDSMSGIKTESSCWKLHCKPLYDFDEEDGDEKEEGDDNDDDDAKTLCTHK